MNNTIKTLSAREALILQQLSEAGEDQLEDMTQELHEPRGRVLSCLYALRKKGLVEIMTKGGEVFVALTNKGKRSINYIWPETQLRA